MIHASRPALRTSICPDEKSEQRQRNVKCREKAGITTVLTLNRTPTPGHHFNLGPSAPLTTPPPTPFPPDADSLH